MKTKYYINMRTLLHYMRRLIIIFLKGVLTFIPKDNKLILFSAWFGKKYADSSMYEFEYLLNNSDYKVYWYTRDIDIFNDLKRRGIPVLYSKTLKAIWYQIKAKVLVTAIQTDDFNPYFFRNCICIDLDHGFVIKQVGFKIPTISKRYIEFRHLLWWGMDFRFTASTDFCRKAIEDSFGVNKERIIKCNKPRTDALFDKELQSGKNVNVDLIKKGRKSIVWMPTHRSSGAKTMNIEKLLDLDTLQKICEEHNIVFLIKKHFYHKKESTNLEIYPNIIDITHEDVDSQVILAQADALISDYSASYIEYLALDRPILLYAFDLEDYLCNERGLYYTFDINTSGEIVRTKEQLNESVARIASDWNDSKFADGRKKAKALFFNDESKPGEYREAFKLILDELIKGTYKANWE